MPQQELFGDETSWARFGRTALTLLACAHFVLSFIAVHRYVILEEYVAGRAALPFQYRVLPMFFMRAFGGVPLLQHIGARMPVEQPSSLVLIESGLVFVSIIAAVYATRGTIVRLTGDRSVARWFCLLVIFMSRFNLASTWGLNYTAPYDVPSVAFFAAGIWLIVTERVAWLYPVFVLATLNRETSCFLIVFYAVWELMRLRHDPASCKPGSRAAVIANSVALVLIWVVIKAVLAHVYRGNDVVGNGIFVYHVVQNIKQLFEPQQWPVLASVCGFTLPLLWFGRRWLRHAEYVPAMLAVLVLWTLGMLCVGTIVEIRIFAEWAALLPPALALMFVDRFRAMKC